MTKERISREDFFKLKADDVVFLKIGNSFYKSRVTRKAFYNFDADEPDWEVETSNGFADVSSIYV